MRKNDLEFFFKGMTFECPQSVYYPSEDSHFLAENVKVGKGASVIDMGCGCGIQSLNALMQGASRVLAIDVDAKALRATKANCEKAGFAGKIETLESALFGKCRTKADVIIFNPPYVESEGIIYKDLDGGKKGREILDAFLAQMPEHLDKGGKCFFLQTNINGYMQTRKKLENKKMGFRVVAKQKGFFEELAVYECTK